MEVQGDVSAIEPCKIFVGGLSWDTNDEKFKKHFESYGEILDTKIMVNQLGQPRGFGFVTFKDPTSVEKVLKEKHIIDDKQVDPKPATLKPPNPKNKCKVFVGGLPGHCTSDQLRGALSNYGNVVTVDIKTDNTPNSVPGESKKNRGFAFVDFEKEDEVSALCGIRYITIDSRQVEVKRAEPRNKKGGPAATPGNKDVSAPFGQSGHYYSAGGMGRGMSGGGATSAHYPYYYPYSFSQFYDYAYGRGTYGGQQPLAAYPDATSGGFSQHRPGAGYGSNPEHFNGGAGYTSYDQSHMTASATGYYDQSVTGTGYTGHTHTQAPATSQQRGSYAYGRS